MGLGAFALAGDHAAIGEASTVEIAGDGVVGRWALLPAAQVYIRAPAPKVGPARIAGRFTDKGFIMRRFLLQAACCIFLVPGTGGIFQVTCNDVLIWDRKREGGFPDPALCAPDSHNHKITLTK